MQLNYLKGRPIKARVEETEARSKIAVSYLVSQTFNKDFIDEFNRKWSEPYE